MRVGEGGEVSLSVRRGDTFVVSVGFYDAVGVAVDVSGWEASFAVWDGPTLLTKVSTASGGVVAGPSGFVVTVADSVTNTLPERAFHEFRVRDPQGRVRTLVEGPFVVSAHVRDGEFDV